MTPQDMHMLKCVHSGEIAFNLSNFAKHGDSGRARFIAKWLPEYISNRDDKSERSFLYSQFRYKTKLGKKVKVDEQQTLVLWLANVAGYSELWNGIVLQKGKTDMERLLSIRDSVSESGWKGFIFVDDDQYIKSLLSSDDCWLIQDSQKVYFVDGNISPGLRVKIVIKGDTAEDKKWNLKLIDFIQSHGFRVEEFNDRKSPVEIFIESAFHNPLVSAIENMSTTEMFAFQLSPKSLTP